MKARVGGSEEPLGSGVLAVIPARSGSKGLPGKNLRDLLGKPLLAWTIQHALECDEVSDVVVSTDSEEIAQVARHYGADVPWLRPAELASDTATSADVLLHAVDNLPKEYEFATLLEPTAPLRKKHDIGNALETLRRQEFVVDSLVTAVKTDFHPSQLQREEGARARQFYDIGEILTLRQQGDPAFLPVGNCFAIRVASLKEEKTLYTKRRNILEIEDWQGFEVDTLLDFNIVEFLFARFAREEWQASGLNVGSARDRRN